MAAPNGVAAGAIVGAGAGAGAAADVFAGATGDALGSVSGDAAAVGVGCVVAAARVAGHRASVSACVTGRGADVSARGTTQSADVPACVVGLTGSPSARAGGGLTAVFALVACVAIVNTCFLQV